MHPDIEVVGTYTGARDPVACRCRKCGHEWSPTADNLLHGRGCPKCAGKAKKTHEEFVAEIAAKHPDIEVVGTYTRSNDRVACRCRKCGHEWSPWSGNLLRGRGCPKCAGRIKTHEEFVAEMQSINKNVEVLSLYETAVTKLRCRCRLCGNTWDATPNALLHGSGCPACSHTATSFMEQFVLISLRKALGDSRVLSRDTDRIGKELDILIPDYDYAIEMGSWFWHKSKLDDDNKKKQLCIEAGITLLTVYDCCDESASPDDYTLIYPFDLAKEKGFSGLKQIVTRALRDIDENKDLNDADWEDIKEAAHLSSRKRTTEEFVEALKKINPDIQVLGEYRGSGIKIACRCRKCGHEWSPTANNLLCGKGCPKCAGRAKKTQEEFVAEMAAKHPNIEVVGTYTRELDRVACRCRKCGYEWSPRADHLSSGHGCPKCAGNARKTHKEFVAEITAKHPNIEVVGTYTRAKDRIACRCKKCGHEWSPMADKLSAGDGCPGCKALTASKRLRKTHEEFVAEMAAKHPDIKVVGTYTRSLDPVACRCKKCGHEWSPRPNNLLRGTGCPKCARKK